MKQKDLFIIAGMPIKDFPEPPEDHEDCKLVTCKYCNKGMWLSRKKRQLIMEMPDSYITCWHCILKKAKKGEFNAAELRMIKL